MARGQSSGAATSFRAARLLFVIPGTFLFLFLPISSVISSPRLVSDIASLYAAFDDDTVTHIRLANSITVSTSKGFNSFPILLGRNCLVDGASGGGYPRLDFNFAPNDRVRLGPGVTLTFRDLVLVNIISRSQLSLDFFAQSASSSSVVWESVVDRRSICQPLQDIKAAWSAATRPAAAGGPQQPQLQEIVEGPICSGDGVCYSTVVLRTVDAVVESRAGYRLRLNGTLTVCENFISLACKESLGSDLCYLNSIEELMAKQNSLNTTPSSLSSSSGSKGLSSAAQAGIIAGCVVGGILVLLLLGGIMFCCQRRRLGDAELAIAMASGRGSGGGGNGEGEAHDTFSILDPNSEAGMQAFESCRSGGDTGTSNILHQQQHSPQPPEAKLGKAAVTHSGGAAPAAIGDDQPSQENSGPVLAAALESAGSLYQAGSAPSAAPRPSGSGTRDMPYSSSTIPSALSPHGGLNAAAIGGSTHSFGSAVISMLRSVLSRASSLTHGHFDHQHHPRTAVAMASPALVSSGGSIVAAMAAASGGPGPSTPSGGGSGARKIVGTPQGSAAMSRRPLSLNSGTLGSGRDSSGGQVALASGSSRPSIGEIQQELERMEEQFMRDARAGSSRGGGHHATAAPARRKSPRNMRGGNGDVVGAVGGGGGGGGTRPAERVFTASAGAEKRP